MFQIHYTDIHNTMQDQRYSDELKYVTLKGVKTSSKKSPQQMATRIAEKIAITICIKIA